MFELAWPWLLLALPLPLLVARVLPRARGAIGDRAAPAASRRRPAAAGRRVAGAAPAPRCWRCSPGPCSRSPRHGRSGSVRREDVPRSGRDLLLAVDTSGSMSIEDMQLGGAPAPRFAAIQAIAADFIQRRAGDRVGLILFGTRAYLLVPLTFDLKTVGKQLADSTIGLAGRETAIGDAVGLAVKRLRDRPQNQRVLVLLTDGVNTSGELDPQKAIDLAVANHVRIYTIGVGADAMRVDSLFGSRVVNPSADLDETMLGEMAQKTGGKYFRARNSDELADIYRSDRPARARRRRAAGPAPGRRAVLAAAGRGAAGRRVRVPAAGVAAARLAPGAADMSALTHLPFPAAAGLAAVARAAAVLVRLAPRPRRCRRLARGGRCASAAAPDRARRCRPRARRRRARRRAVDARLHRAGRAGVGTRADAAVSQPGRARARARARADDAGAGRQAEPARRARATRSTTSSRAASDYQTALIGYAGDAFVAAPLTDDADTVRNLVDALDPGTMPVAGNATARAIDARRRADRAGRPARRRDHPARRQRRSRCGGGGAPRARARHQRVGARRRQRRRRAGAAGAGRFPARTTTATCWWRNSTTASLRAVAAAGGGRYATLSRRCAATSIRLLVRSRRGRRAPGAAGSAGETAESARWRDRGPWLLLLLLPLALLRVPARLADAVRARVGGRRRRRRGRRRMARSVAAPRPAGRGGAGTGRRESGPRSVAQSPRLARQRRLPRRRLRGRGRRLRASRGRRRRLQQRQRAGQASAATRTRSPRTMPRLRLAPAHGRCEGEPRGGRGLRSSSNRRTSNSSSNGRNPDRAIPRTSKRSPASKASRRISRSKATRSSSGRISSSRLSKVRRRIRPQRRSSRTTRRTGRARTRRTRSRSSRISSGAERRRRRAAAGRPGADADAGRAAAESAVARRSTRRWRSRSRRATRTPSRRPPWRRKTRPTREKQQALRALAAARAGRSGRLAAAQVPARIPAPPAARRRRRMTRFALRHATHWLLSRAACAVARRARGGERARMARSRHDAARRDRHAERRDAGRQRRAAGFLARCSRTSTCSARSRASRSASSTAAATSKTLWAVGLEPKHDGRITIRADHGRRHAHRADRADRARRGGRRAAGKPATTSSSRSTADPLDAVRAAAGALHGEAVLRARSHRRQSRRAASRRHRRARGSARAGQVYIATIGARRYHVVERHYALTPERSGDDRHRRRWCSAATRSTRPIRPASSAAAAASARARMRCTWRCKPKPAQWTGADVAAGGVAAAEGRERDCPTRSTSAIRSRARSACRRRGSASSSCRNSLWPRPTAPRLYPDKSRHAHARRRRMAVRRARAQVRVRAEPARHADDSRSQGAAGGIPRTTARETAELPARTRCACCLPPRLPGSPLRRPPDAAATRTPPAALRQRGAAGVPAPPAADIFAVETAGRRRRSRCG